MSTILLAVAFLFTILANQAQESDAGTFDDMGRFLVGGLLLAVASALIVAFITIKMRKRSDGSSDFTSIASK